MADDRVVVEGLLDGTSVPTSAVGDWNDQRSTVRQGSSFAGLSLMRAGDSTTYLPVADAKGRCLCTPFPVRWQSSFPVFVVMTAPREDDQISLLLNAGGSIGPLEVTR